MNLRLAGQTKVWQFLVLLMKLLWPPILVSVLSLDIGLATSISAYLWCYHNLASDWSKGGHSCWFTDFDSK